MSLALMLVSAVLAGATLAYVLAPLLWPPEAGTSPAAGADEALEVLLQRRAAAYQAIRELEADRRLGRLDEQAYAAARAELEQRAIDALRAIDAWEAEADATLARVPAVPGRPGAEATATHRDEGSGRRGGTEMRRPGDTAP